MYNSLLKHYYNRYSKVIFVKNSTQVLIHSPANFPYVRERGFLVGLGQEVNVQVDATGTSTYSGISYFEF